ncbi:hypothetical protein GQ53DRAFT_883260 [Thozetella sp. PMI_491]|nr:hypothetical protein GQ53DRAFT_883260 [Thozetella sp. PMI_491]
MVSQVAIPRCPGVSLITYEKHWYRLPGVNFDACSRCFLDRLSQTPFADQFVVDYDPSDQQRSCDFDTPRITSELAQALRANDFGILQRYMVFRAELKPCKRNIMIADDYNWWGMAGKPLDDFAVCDACYHDYIVPRGWAPLLKDYPEKQTSEPYICETGLAIGARAAKNCATLEQFESLMSHFFTLPACNVYEPFDPETDTQTWYKMKPQDLSHVWICEFCYHEYIAASALEPHAYAFGTQNTGAPLKCTAGSVLSFKMALNWGLQRNDFNMFYTAAQKIARSPPCVKEGMGPEAGWMSLQPPAEGFDVCGSCFAAFIEAPGFPDRFTQFSKTYVAPGTTLRCSFNPQSSGGKRAALYFNLLDAALDSGDPAKFTEPVRILATTPACPRGEPQRELVWYLNDTYVCCPECWVAIVRGTALDHRAFPVRRNENVGWAVPLKCDFWSPRVRGLWAEAIEKNDLTEFDRFMLERLQVFGQTWPQINDLRGSMRNGMMMQMNTYQNAFILNVGSSISAAAGGGSGSYGNSSIGFYPTMSGAQSAQLFNQASGMGGDHGPTLQRIAELEAVWKAVE